MGIMTSRLGAYSNSMMMDTSTMLHFRDELQRQQETARAAGQMQAIQQMQSGQIGSGGGGGTMWSGQLWYTIMESIQKLAIPFVPIGGIVIGIVYALQKTQMAMFGAVVFTVFFATAFFFGSIQWGKQGIVTGFNFGISLFVALGIGALVAFVMYHPDSKNGGDPIYIKRGPVGDDPFFSHSKLQVS